MRKQNILELTEEPAKKHQKLKFCPFSSGITASMYFFMLYSKPAYAADIWTKANVLMRDIYNQILGISTIAGVVTVSIALLLMNFSKSGRTVDESRAWLKRIIISWVILNSLGFILAYVTPFFQGGQWVPGS